MADARSPRALKVAVVTPEGSAYEGAAEQVVVPAFDGEIAFLPGHAPFLGLLGLGELRITGQAGAAASRFFLAGGVVQVQDDEVVLLAERVVPAARLDAAQSRQELAQALATPAAGEAQLAAREARIAAARARLRVAERAD